MQRLIFSCMCFFLASQVNAQQFTYRTKDHTSPLPTVIRFSETGIDFDARLQLIKNEAPAPVGSTKYLKNQLDQQRGSFIAPRKEELSKKASTPPVVLGGFAANAPQGTPCDNDMAVSNSGMVISVVNSNITIYNDTGRALLGRSLASFARDLGTLDRTFDPRVIYDPLSDRFIVVFLQGSTSEDTRVITGFSQSSDPTKEWNFYAIPGNIFGDSTWSDYPIISLTNNELFITLNRVKDNTPWQQGFVESLIWQVNKHDGYAGDSLRKKVYYDIRYNNKSIWSICPVKGSNTLYGPNMYFVSVRPSDLENDTVFLHEITGSLESASLTLKVIKSNRKYGLQPNAPQPDGQYLQTNDARALSAVKHDNLIHYVGNTIDPALFAPGVYYGKIDLSDPGSPVVSGQIISYDSMDIGYPSIAYAGGGFKTDQTMMITFSHVSSTKFPGTTVVYAGSDGAISSPMHIKEGEGSVNVLTDTLERWGDYTGIQTRYNAPGECWLANSYGLSNSKYRTWVGRIKSSDPKLGVNDRVSYASGIKVYPVPSADYTHIEFELKQGMMLTFTLTDLQGKTIASLLRDKGKPGINRFTFTTEDLTPGTYLLNVTGNDQVIISRRILVAH